jgi:predicted SAM-dependent methyltransferase
MKAVLRAFLKRRMSRGLRRSLVNLKQEFRIHRLHRASLKRAPVLANRHAEIRLNLGSGLRPKQGAGWINIDLSETADLRLDLREPLPFGDNSVAQIYTEHFLEHLHYPNQDDSSSWQVEAPERPSEVMSFLRECRRVLVPGGLLDVVVPDAECIVNEYCARRQAPFPMYAWWGPKWCSTAMHCVNYVFRQGTEHKYAYDEETLASVLRSAEFVAVTRRLFDPVIDADNHEIGSLCMIARKPAAVSETVGVSAKVGLSAAATRYCESSIGSAPPGRRAGGVMTPGAGAAVGGAGRGGGAPS